MSKANHSYFLRDRYVSFKKYLQEFCRNKFPKGWSVHVELKYHNAWAVSLPSEKRIYVNPDLLEDFILEDFEHIEQILIHELAHAHSPPGDYHSEIWRQKAFEMGMDKFYDRYDWARCQTPDTVFYINYLDAKVMLDTDSRCMEIARGQTYMYDLSLGSPLPDNRRITRQYHKRLVRNLISN